MSFFFRFLHWCRRPGSLRFASIDGFGLPAPCCCATKRRPTGYHRVVVHGERASRRFYLEHAHNPQPHNSSTQEHLLGCPACPPYRADRRLARRNYFLFPVALDQSEILRTVLGAPTARIITDLPGSNPYREKPQALAGRRTCSSSNEQMPALSLALSSCYDKTWSGFLFFDAIAQAYAARESAQAQGARGGCARLRASFTETSNMDVRPYLPGTGLHRVHQRVHRRRHTMRSGSRSPAHPINK